MADRSALNCEGLSVDIGRKRIVSSVNLTLGYGQWFGILGVNGSGKTTLLNAVSGRLPVSEGIIRIEDKELTNAPAQRAAAWGFAPPPDSLPPELTGGVLLELVAQARNCPPLNDTDIMEALEFSFLSGKFIGTMSAGQKQKIALMSAFVGSPQRLILDEPFNWLDPLAIYALKEALTRRAREGVLIVTALHDVSSFMTRCDAGLLLADGKIKRHFSSEDFIEGRKDVIGFERDIYGSFRNT